MGCRPTYVVFAGVNGAGKSTFYRSNLWQQEALDARMPRVNPDEIIAASGRDWASPADQMWAGKQALGQIRTYFEKRESFNQETTLSGHAAIKRIKEAYGLGYKVRMFYIGVDSPKIAIERIGHRAEIGGHDIDERLVLRRFEASLKAFGEAFDFTHEAISLDNSQGFSTIAIWKNATLCWWSPEQNRLHPWLIDAMQSDDWREAPRRDC